MKKNVLLAICIGVCLILSGCRTANTDSTKEEKYYQETLMQQANDKVGNPEITEFYEKKLAKEILELRDNSDLVCYAYTKVEGNGKYVYIGRCMGYGLPYSTQYTNPEKYIDDPNGTLDAGSVVIPQADPNGLYSPDGLSATWLWLIDENTGEPNVMYIEPEILVSQSKLPSRICESWSLPSNY